MFGAQKKIATDKNCALSVQNAPKHKKIMRALKLCVLLLALLCIFEGALLCNKNFAKKFVQIASQISAKMQNSALTNAKNLQAQNFDTEKIDAQMQDVQNFNAHNFLLEPEPFLIQIDENLKGGTIYANTKRALPGETVLLEIAPSKNKRLAKNSTKYELVHKNKNVTIKNNQFTMPNGNLVLTARFEYTLDGIILDPKSFAHGTVALWRDDAGTVHVGTRANLGYAPTTVTLSSTPFSLIDEAGSAGKEAILAVENATQSFAEKRGKNTYLFDKKDDEQVVVLVNWEPVKYSIAYFTDGGGFVDENSALTSYNISDDFYELPGAQKMGYTFLGWIEDSDDKARTSILPKTVGDLKYRASWQAVAYNINYHNTFDEQFSAPKTYTTEKSTSLPHLKRAGFAFLGWFDNDALTGEPQNSIPEGELGDKDFYAKWQVVPYTLTYNLKGGNFLQDEPLQSYTVSDDAYTLPLAQKRGYTFAGWRITGAQNENAGAELNTHAQNAQFANFASGTAQSVASGAEHLVNELAPRTTGNLVCTAEWLINTYNFACYDESGNCIQNATYTVEDTILLPELEKQDYVFAGWAPSPSIDANGAEQNVAKLIQKGTVGNLNLYPKWRAKQYECRLHLYESPKQKIDIVHFTVEDKEKIIQVPVREGWTFEGWYSDEARTIKTVAKIPAHSNVEKDFYAKWSCTVSFDANGGTLCDDVNLKSTNAYLGTLPSPTKEHYEFAGWYFDKGASKEARAGSEVLQSCTLYANWRPISYSITYNANGGMMPNAYLDEYTVETTQSALPVPKRKGFAFAGWFADASFKTPVESAMKSGAGESRNLFSRTLKSDGFAQNSFVHNNLQTDFAQTGFAQTDLQTGIFSMDDLYEERYKADEKPVVTSNLTVYAKWFNFDVKVVNAGKYLSSIETQEIKTIDHNLEVSTTEITRETYRTVMGLDPSDNAYSEYSNASEQMQNPVQMVNWFDALVFCNKLSALNGYEPVYSINGSTNPDDWGDVPNNNDVAWTAVKWNKNALGYRLPTEEEWIWIAMGGSCEKSDLNADGVNVQGINKKFAGHNMQGAKASGKKIKDYAWYSSNAKNKSHPVASTLPNEAGLYDLSGNVWEWCWDAYVPTEAEIKQAEKEGTKLSSFCGEYFRTIRGGSWYSFAGYVSLASRMSLNIYAKNNITGFRVVRTIPVLD